MRNDLLRAAHDPQLKQLGIEPGWILGFASHLTAKLNGWLER